MTLYDLLETMDENENIIIYVDDSEKWHCVEPLQTVRKFISSMRDNNVDFFDFCDAYYVSSISCITMCVNGNYSSAFEIVVVY